MGKRNFQYYVVLAGKQTGIFDNWNECNAQVMGVSGAIYKGFRTKSEAELYYVSEGRLGKRKLTLDDDRKQEEKDLSEQVEKTQKIRKIFEKKTSVNEEPRNNMPVKGTLEVYADGSCIDNGKPTARAGIGVHFTQGYNDISLPFTLDNPTNQRAELWAIYQAISCVDDAQDLKIYTDSEYSINCLTKWRFDWYARGWKKADGKQVLNLDIIIPLTDLIDKRKGNTTFQWVRGHSNCKGNLIADTLALTGALMNQ
jgi:ribonuclease HI